MSNYDYLKIDFYGQFNADTIHKLTYPEPYNPMDSSSQVWLNPITDPRSMRTLFPVAKHGYRIHRDSNGTYYSFITRYERDSRQGYVAITVMIGAKYESIISGKNIYDLLNILKTDVLDNDNFTVEAVEQCLEACNMPQHRVQPMRFMPVEPNWKQAFRVYSTNAELYDIFQFPDQADYDQYGEVFFISKFWCNNSVPGVDLLTSNIIKTYTVSKPSNVACEGSVKTGETINLTYTKPGFAPLVIPITVSGINNQFLHYEGATIKVLEPKDLPFKQRVNIKVNINGNSYTDSKVNASIGGELLRYSSEIGAYTTEVTREALDSAEIPIGINVFDPSIDPERMQSKKDSIARRWLIPLLTFLLGVLVGGAVTWFLMRNNTKENDSDNKATVETSTSVTSAQSQKSTDSTQPDEVKLEEDDINYMKHEKEWNADNIKSTKYKKFFANLINGNVEDVIKTVDELKSNNKPINVFLKGIVDLAIQNPKITKTVLRTNDGKSINLKDKLKDLRKKINEEVYAANSGYDDYQNTDEQQEIVNDGTETSIETDGFFLNL